jgi:hypothetical protein
MTHGESNGRETNDGGLSDQELTEKDTSYSPASEAETQAKQDDPVPETVEPGAADRMKVAPGTGGPDDPGDIEVDPGDIQLGGDEE